MTQLAETPAALCVSPVLFAGSEVLSGPILHSSIASSADAGWADDVVASLGAGERAVCSLAFAPGGSAVAHRVALRTPVHRSAATAASPTGRTAHGADFGGYGSAGRHAVSARPTEQEYADAVAAALHRIEDGEVDKVVLGRCLDVVSEPPLDPAAVVARLLEARPGRYVFGLPLTADPAGPVLLGASPELLVRRTGRFVTSLPLAGSAPRAADRAEDRRRAAALQDSTKDLAEHAYVVEAILAALAPFCVEIDAAPRAQLVSTDTLHHLGTPIRARLDPGVPGPSALHLAQLLQPTPAVGGVPTDAALALIDELEPEDRGPLAGAVGWVDAAGDGELAVTIRAGVLDGPRLRLFAGAGIVAGSDPWAEVRETGAKLGTMMRAVGLAEVR